MSTSIRRRLGGLMAGLAALALTAPVSASAAPLRSHRQWPALFAVGAAVVGINPTVTTYSGGFGASPPIPPGRVVGDALSVRAMYITNGTKAVEIAVVDSQAEFAAYQAGLDYGITYARTVAASEIDASGHGPKLSAGDIIIQATHSHSAPTLEGLWGPVPVPYLHQVTQAEIAALVDAARHPRPARLQVGSANASALDDVALAQYDAFPGWGDDPLLSVLRAVSPSGETIATYVTVPAHPDIVCGACLGLLTADYDGVVRESLQGQLGGVTLVGPGTLGREETPVQATSIADMHLLAAQVTDLADSALDHARWITDNRLGAAQRFVHIPGTNPLLLSLVEANRLPAAEKQAIENTTGEYPIDRADTPPYLTGAVIGTWLTALRVGDVAYVSAPGEPFPQVRETIAAATSGASYVVILSKAQDDLGYFYPSWVAPFAAAVFPSDQFTNSASAVAGDAVIDGQLADLAELGFTTSAALPGPPPIDAAQVAEPGIQATGGPFTGDAGSSGRLSVALLATYSPPDLPEGELAYGAPAGNVPVEQGTKGPLRWSFGDGTTTTSGYHEFSGTDVQPVSFTHAFAPGRHLVRLAVTSATGQVATSSFVVQVYPQLQPSVRATRQSGGRVTLTAHILGGDGQILSYRWDGPTGPIGYGPCINVPGNTEYVLSVTDGTGTTATARWS